MGIPFDRLASVLKAGAAVRGEVDAPVRVGVYVDGSTTRFLIDTVRAAFVPQTTSALVRVERLGEGAVTVKPDTDIALVLSCGSVRLQGAVQEIVVTGTPTAVIAESSVEVPFIGADTPMLGLIAATDANHLLEELARWILDRTEKAAAFAANFAFMRTAAANRTISSTALANTATGALAFIPGADFPVMTVAQLGMMLQLSGIYGKPLRPERGYEAAGIVAAAVALRTLARFAARRAGRASFIVKALVGGTGTYAMGRALSAVYERDIDYAPLNDAIASLVRRVRAAADDGGALAQNEG